jgi:hypothetical protein
MHPPALLPAEVKSAAEVKVFEALRDQLDDGWEVFHSASVVFRDAADGAKDDEGDFVLCHPDQGIVVLEVKGGGLECRHGAWFRVARDGSTERMRDPFTQALDHRYSLQRKIDEVDGWHGRDLLITHAIAFPDISVHELVLAPDAPPEIVVDRNGVKDIGGALEQTLAYHRGVRERRRVPGSAGADMLRELLAPRFRIEVPLATAFDEEERELVLLTHDQALLLQRLGRARRLVVTGCAGSGKTMLAVERARELTGAGRRVLFVCFNKALAMHLRAQAGFDGLDIFHFHSLCMHWAKRAGVAVPSYDGDAPQAFWDSELPDALVEAMAEVGPPYDDILVDEAQDLHTDWLAALTCTLREEGEGSVWLFMDDNQRVYAARLDVPREYVPYDLDVNCRNTQAIHREVMKLYQGAVKPRVLGPPGRAVELVPSGDEPATVAAIVERLCGADDVRPQDIVVLSAHGRKRSSVLAAGLPRGLRYVDERGRRGIYFSSIRGFKGLESPVVILCELGDLDDESRNQQLYVGLSRARNHCVIVSPQLAKPTV